MPATRQQNDFRNRTNRFRTLKTGKYHQTIADEGIYLLYRRGPKRSAWYVRPRGGQQRCIGLADDYQDADGDAVLTYHQAVQIALRKAKKAAEADRAPEPRGGYTVEQAAKAYLKQKKAHGLKSVAETERVIEKDILPNWKTIPLKQATKRRINDWIADLVSAPCRTRSGNELPLDGSKEAKRRRRATAQRKYTILRAVLNFAYEQDMVGAPAWKGVKDLRNIDPPEDKFPTLAECKRLARRVPDEFRPVVEATFLTGAGYGELTSMQVKDYRPDSGHVIVFDSKRRNRAIPLTPEGIAVFDEQTADKSGNDLIFTHADGSPWGKSEQSRPLREANRLAKIDPPITLTRLRKAYGSLLLNAGVSLDVVAKAMGHADTRITRRHYSRLLQSTIDEQIRAALPSLGIERKVARIK